MNRPGGDRAASSPTQELAERAVQGESRAYRALQRSLEGPVRRFFFQRTAGDSAVVEELTHEALSEGLLALAERKYTSEKAQFTTFMYGVMRNVLARYSRSKNRLRSDGTVSLDAASARGETQRLAYDYPVPPFDLIEAMRYCLSAEGTPFALTPEERFVILGRARQETFAWLAERLGCSLSTASERMARASEKLRKCMALKGYR